MKQVIVYINLTLIIYSLWLYISAINAAAKIEYNLRADALLNRLYDDKVLFRIAMRVKLWLLLLLTILMLCWYGGKIIPAYEFYASNYLAAISALFSLAWFLLALLMYLIYSTKDFTIFKITKREPTIKK